MLQTEWLIWINFDFTFDGFLYARYWQVVYDITTNVNNALKALRKELEYDEGLAGQIYRASEPSEILTSDKEYPRKDVDKALENAWGKLGSAYIAMRDAFSDTSEGKSVPDFRKARCRENNISIGENEQRERSRRFISMIMPFYKSPK